MEHINDIESRIDDKTTSLGDELAVILSLNADFMKHLDPITRENAALIIEYYKIPQDNVKEIFEGIQTTHTPGFIMTRLAFKGRELQETNEFYRR